MREIEQRQTETLRRVQGFMGAHADTLGPIAQLEGRVQLDEAVTAIDTLTNHQVTANRFSAGEMNRQDTLIRELVREHLIPVARFARAKLAKTPDFKALTPSVTPDRRGRLLGDARATATAVAKHSEAFAAGGFPPDAAQQINALVDQIMAVQAERAKLRGSRVNATKAIKQEIAKGMSGVKHLDALIIKRFASNPGLLAEWASVSRVREKSGVARKPVAAEPAPTPEQPALV